MALSMHILTWKGGIFLGSHAYTKNYRQLLAHEIGENQSLLGMNALLVFQYRVVSPETMNTQTTKHLDYHTKISLHLYVTAKIRGVQKLYT